MAGGWRSWSSWQGWAVGLCEGDGGVRGYEECNAVDGRHCSNHLISISSASSRSHQVAHLQQQLQSHDKARKLALVP